MTGCDTIRPLISSYVDGEASAEEVSLVQTHLKTCDKCQSHLVFLKMLGPAINNVPTATPSPMLFDRIAKATYAKPTWQQKYLGWLAPLPLRWTVGPGLVAATVVAVLVAPRVMQVTPDTPNTNTVAVNKTVPTPPPAEGTVKPAPAPTPPETVRPGTMPPTAARVAVKPTESRTNTGSRPEQAVTPEAPAKRVAIAPETTTVAKPKTTVAKVKKPAETTRIATNITKPNTNPIPPVKKPSALPTPPPKTTVDEPIVIASAPDRDTSASNPSAAVAKPITIASNVKPETPSFNPSAAAEPEEGGAGRKPSLISFKGMNSERPTELGDVNVRKTLARTSSIVPIADSPVK